jgi:hypothetical protein
VKSSISVSQLSSVQISKKLSVSSSEMKCPESSEEKSQMKIYSSIHNPAGKALVVYISFSTFPNEVRSRDSTTRGLEFDIFQVGRLESCGSSNASRG